MATHGTSLEQLERLIKTPFRGKKRPGRVDFPGPSSGAGLVLEATGSWVASVGVAAPATSVESETSFGLAPAVGSSTDYARSDHTHGTPAEPVTGGGGSSDGVMRGVSVAYNNAASVDMVPIGEDGLATLSMWNGTIWQLFSVSSTKNASLAASGAAGLDTGAEAASTFYHLWAIGKADGTFALLLSLSATSPTMPSGYTFKALIGGVANDGSSNIVEFQQLSDGRFMYTGTQVDSVRGVNVLSGGTSTSFAAIDLSKAIPDIPGLVYGAQLRAANSNATNSVITFSEDSGGTVHLVTTRSLSTGAGTTVIFDIDARHTGNRATSLYYDWSVSTAGLDTDVYVKWWSLGSRTGGSAGGAAVRYSDDETITGTIDGANDTFVLAHTPSPAASLQLILDGVHLKQGVGYTLSGDTVTMQAGYVPATGSILSAFFRY